jgi:FKBP-type peptidyl-prolyl cis-trans isomerase
MQVNFKYCFYILLALFLFQSCKNNSRNKNNPENIKPSGEEMMEVNRILVKKDQMRIRNYITRMGWKMNETETGLWYEIISEGSGRQAETGKLATLNYMVSLLEGNVCYSSRELGPKQFVIGKGNVEAGLEQSILLLKEGSKARFVLPPHLAHGLPGDGNKIPARAIIIYEVELLSVTNP